MRLGQALALVATLAYIGCVVPQLNRPLMYDDANFALAAKAIADTGLPYGNQGWMSERGDFSQREQWALWHPPLYIYAEGVLAKVGGWTPPVLRLLGFVAGLFTAVLTWHLARQVTRGLPAVKELAAGVAVALVLMCPLTVQSALVLDVDYALLLPLTLAFLLAYMRLEASTVRWLWLVPLFAVMLWAKMTNPLALVVVVAVWQVLRGKIGRAALHLAVIGAGGAALFGVSWLLVGRALGFPLDMPFGVNLVQWRDSAEVARRAYTSPGAFLEGFQPMVIWLGPGLVSLGLFGVGVRGAQLVCRWRFRTADLLIGVLTVFSLGYVNKYAGWFPKYQVALVPLLACLAAPLLAQLLCARPRAAFFAALAGGVATLVITGTVVRDGWALQRTWALQPVVGAAYLGIAMLALLLGVRWRAPAVTGVLALAGLAFGWATAVDVVQVRAAYQTDYWYGTTGTAEAADWVSAHLAPDETYLAAKEVAIRGTDQRYVDQDNLVYLLDTGQKFDGVWAGERLHALVLWERDAYVADRFDRAVPSAGFLQAERFGDYVVYVPVS
jgi:4-amino-4-deoxy-L-arabinose transferase-like glycosyltransferase